MVSDSPAGRVGREPRSRRAFLALGAVAGSGLLAGCTEGGGSDDGGNGDGNGGLSGDISITGSSTVFPLATAVAEAFREDHPEVNVDIQSTGSGGGFENFFCPGDSDLNNASRPIGEGERASCEDNGVDPLELRVATDALTVVVNNENDWATEMTVDELAQIWGPEAGDDQTWADVNADWPDEEIERFGAAETSGTFDYFTANVVGEEGAHTQNYEPTEDDRSIVTGVQGNPHAIGYFGFSYYYNNPDAVTAVAVDAGDGPVEPSLDTAASGEYAPLARPLFTYVDRNRLSADHVAEFCRFFVEQSGVEDLVAGRVGYVPNTDEQVQDQLDTLESAVEGVN